MQLGILFLVLGCVVIGMSVTGRTAQVLTAATK